jgi:hypothetical protein
MQASSLGVDLQGQGQIGFFLVSFIKKEGSLMLIRFAAAYGQF